MNNHNDIISQAVEKCLFPLELERSVREGVSYVLMLRDKQILKSIDEIFTFDGRDMSDSKVTISKEQLIEDLSLILEHSPQTSVAVNGGKIKNG